MDPAKTFTPELLDRMVRNADVVRWGGLLAMALELGWLWFVAGAAGRRWWQAWSLRLGRRRTPLLDRVLGPSWLAGGLFLACVGAELVLVAWPVDVAVSWWWARREGTSVETFGHFAGTSVLEAVRLGWGFGALGLAIDAVRARWPRRWWLGLGLAGSAVLVAATLAEPLWTHARFEVTPLPDGPLRTRLERSIADAGAPPHALVVVDASKVGPGVNAFATGLGPTRRLVLTDTLLEQGDDAAAGAVLRELGHRRAERLPWRLVFAGALLPFLLWLVDRLLSARRRAGAPSDAQAVPWVVFAFTLGGFALGPVKAAVSRAEERGADAFELAARTDLDAYVRDVVDRAVRDLEPPDPHPWDALFASHPSVSERIGAARAEQRRRGAR